MEEKNISIQIFSLQMYNLIQILLLFLLYPNRQKQLTTIFQQVNEYA